MKTVLFILFVASAVAYRATDDVIKLMTGFLEGIQATEDRNDLIKCADERIWRAWEETIPQLRLVMMDDPTKIVEGISIMLRAPFESITFLRACSKEEFQKPLILSEHSEKRKSNSTET